jgi:HD-like signal output (HDOD) protein
MVATDAMGSPARVNQLIARLPAFSPVALRLMAVIADENVSFKDVAKLISLDPAISGEVLKLANSGFYGRRASVHSIVHAIALVGIRRVSPIVITAAIWKALPRQPSPMVKAWWRHSIASALIAEHLSQENHGIESAYTASLLHAIGQLALLESSRQEYSQVLDLACAIGGDLLESERRTFGFDHAQLSGMILDRWNLPLSIQEAVAMHHCHEASSPLMMAVQTGCFAAEYVGFGTCGCHQEIAAAEISVPVAQLIESKYLIETLPQEVNGIECSLL